MTFRSRRFLDLAHDMRACQVQIADVCQGESPDGLEPAHANWQWMGRGIGRKADDIFAAACPACHRKLDASGMSRQDREYYWMRGTIRTYAYLMRTGLLAPSGIKTVHEQR